MNIRSPFLWLVFSAVGISLLAAVAAAAEPEKLPNVVMIISDDQAWSDYGFMGHDMIQTPHLDKLTRESLTFTRGYVPSSLCRPSLMTMITGLYPHQHGITGNDPTQGTDRNEMLKHVKAHATLPKLLAEKGYVSMQTGKWWEGNHTLGGFTSGMTHGNTKKGGRHGDEGLRIARQGMQPIFEFIEGRQGKPFFLWHAPFLPHTPHNPPQRLLAKYQDKVDSTHVARYYAMCEWFDETCGELLDYLDKENLRENTLVIYVTDNGWIQQPNSGQYAPKSKRSPYDGGIRTPIMLNWPGTISPKLDETTLASSIDLAPTILTACGVKTPEEMPGLNLLDQEALQARAAIFGDIYQHDVADIDDPAASLLFRWCIAGHEKLILPVQGEPELYNLQDDPWEKKNLAENKPAVVDQLRRQIDGWWKP